MVGNVLIYLGVVAAPTLVFAALLALPRWTASLRRLRAPAPTPSHPPVERLVADLRRVRKALTGFGEGTPVVRRRAATAAYDALLVQTCDSVGVVQHLDEYGEGFERDVERLRAEQALRDEGLLL
ncbi:hypothetical protein B1813_14050 [Saccharomonospora piscinae]|uniref:Uncharacterized protein n=1 Tax=Saccharomonospora piscinae TaxID=687388 RepID=A0A1V9A0K3_SACPI|nr:hypothetical protein [Saccharomonospora piscinae]OQO90669.1 hypothetical protein B1813_14050 [Saccharomonospora piscinae]TLW93339.1 hypothetical protein FFT09_07985 [Saccharomonospora piscinae]